MPDSDKFFDPRLIAKESLFAQLHLDCSEAISNLNTILLQVTTEQTDITADNPMLQALQDSFLTLVNAHLTLPTDIWRLQQHTLDTIENNEVANATKAQVLTMAINTLKHWQILSEIPRDLLDIAEVSATVKQKFAQHLAMWQRHFDQTSHIH